MVVIAILIIARSVAERCQLFNVNGALFYIFGRYELDAVDSRRGVRIVSGQQSSVYSSDSYSNISARKSVDEVDGIKSTKVHRASRDELNMGYVN